MISIHPPVSASWRRGSSSTVCGRTREGREELQVVKTVGRGAVKVDNPKILALPEQGWTSVHRAHLQILATSYCTIDIILFSYFLIMIGGIKNPGVLYCS